MKIYRNPHKTRQPDWESLRKHFPVANEYVYFNHAAIAPIPLFVKEKITACIQEYCEKGIVCNKKFLDVVESTRELAALLIGALPSQIAFINNTTQGILLAANGIRWKRGDNVIIPEKEFPANVYPWLNLRKKGVEVRFLPLKQGRFAVEDIAKYADKRTKAVSVSAVSFANGFRCHLEKIGEFCKENGILFVVDAIQALGAVELDVEKSYVDVLSADSHKWLIGPQGIGILFISDNALKVLDVSNLGWKSVENEDEFLKYDMRLKSSAKRFEEGTLNIFGIIGLKASLEMILDIGITLIHERILQLTDLLIDGLRSRGYTFNSSLSRSERSGIISFRHCYHKTKDIFDKLFEAKVVCAKRDGAIRISPHFYNNSIDIDNFLKALF